MEPAVLSALSAILGSAVGGSATIATAWLTQRTQGQRERIHTEIRKREQLYVEFIAEASKLIIEALDHQLQSPERLTALYSVVNRIRLRCSDDVLAAAEGTVTRIVERFFGPNLSPEEMRQTVLARTDDPLKDFSRKDFSKPAGTNSGCSTAQPDLLDRWSLSGPCGASARRCRGECSEVQRCVAFTGQPPGASSWPARGCRTWCHFVLEILLGVSCSASARTTNERAWAS